ncbi:hypothetical protein QTP88_010535 [Uroleucon formosanum]
MISLDITKAYDSVWRHRILQILSKILINGNMYNYIKNFLSDRKFRVKVSNCLSNIFTQENGIPQESSLAVTIFLLSINDIVKTIETPVTANLFADDLNILCRSSNLNTVQHLLQNSANNITKWLNKTGFNISSQKSQSIIFTKKRKQDSVGIAIVAENTITTYKLPPECSIYTAEALAIYNATLHIMQNKNTTPNNYLVISDSLSSITGIQNITHPSDISKLIQEKTYEASGMGMDICYMWAPGHCGIQGNEKADLEASKAASSPDTPLLNIYT